MIELYDIGRTTHRAVHGMYEFIVNNIDRYVRDRSLAERLRDEALNREVQGHSISQEYFSAMCDVWARAYREGSFSIDLEATIFPDTVSRFRRVKENGRRIGILTSASRDFTNILYDLSIGDNQKLSNLVDDCFLGEEIGDKDFADTFARLWENTEGGIYAVFDDKPSVCKAALEGIKLADGSAKIYLVDRKNQYSGDLLKELEDKGVIKISNFDEVKD